MGFRVFIILICTSLWAGVSHAEKQPFHKGSLELLPYRFFQTMNTPDQLRYLSLLQDFLAKQEMKWHGKMVSKGSTPFESLMGLLSADLALAAEPSIADKGSSLFDAGTCSNLDSIPETFSKFIANGKNKCLIGGFMVCLNFSGSTLKCNTTDPTFQKFAQTQCPNQPGFVPCAPPFFLNDQGGILCVPGTGPNGEFLPITSKCKAQTNTNKVLENLLKNPPLYANEYSFYKKQFEAYCGDEGRNAHYFDIGDCRTLQHSLDKVKTLAQAVAPLGNKLCHNQVTLSGKPVEVKLLLSSPHEQKIQLLSENPPEGWTPTMCGALGDVITPGGLRTPCLSHQFMENNQPVTEVVSFADYGSGCEMTYRSEIDGIIDKNGVCRVQFRGKNLWAFNGKAYSAPISGSPVTELVRTKFSYANVDAITDPHIFFDPKNKVCKANVLQTPPYRDLTGTGNSQGRTYQPRQVGK